MRRFSLWGAIFYCLSCLATLKAQNVHTVVDSTQYATIYICRPNNFFGSAVGFGIRNDGIKLFKLRNNSIRELKIYQPGPVMLSARCVDRVSKITIPVELGKRYYVRCTPQISYLFANPKLRLVEIRQAVVKETIN